MNAKPDGEMKHTLGPWEWQTFDGTSLFLGTPDRGRLVVLDSMVRGTVPKKGKLRFAIREGNSGGLMKEATVENIGRFPDARLIAAAPELLEACKAFIRQREFEKRGDGDTFWIPANADACRAIDAAIAKAEGK